MLGKFDHHRQHWLISAFDNLASANRNTDMVEYLTGSPFIDDIVEKKWKLDDSGMLLVPNGPGLGISLNLGAVEKHTGQRFCNA